MEKGGSHAKVFRRPVVDKMLEELAKEEPLGVSVAPVAPDPLNRFLGWDTSWGLPEGWSLCASPGEARIWSKLVSANSTLVLAHCLA